MTMLRRLSGPREFLIGLHPALKRVLIVGIDLGLIPLSLWLALSLRLGEWFGIADINAAALAFIALTLFTIVAFVRLGLYRAVLRYGGWQLFERLAQGVLISSSLLLVAMMVFPSAHLPRSTVVIYGLVALPLLGGTRWLIKLFLAVPVRGPRGPAVAIYGAGAAGRRLASLLHTGGAFEPALFLDDDRSLNGRKIQGIEIIHPRESELPAMLDALGIKDVFISIPSANLAQKRRIVEGLKEFHLHIQTVPDLHEILSGAARLEQVREIEIEELLGREPVPPRAGLLDRCIKDKTVLVTGAAGSIGSELCRQVLSQNPRKVILFDHSEYGLYTIEAELRKLANAGNGGSVPVVPLLGSVNDLHRLNSIFSAFDIDTVYHAAAYKHVPLVEYNPFEGIKTNAFGTWNVADCARAAGVKHFVLISTDKAVRPTNIMGASKRVAELVLQAFQNDGGNTVFSMVRFGNVLGSSGSVVPLFREQIRGGGPVTVTHPEVTRYFMTIPEAVQLVIQAGALAKGGEVFVLDMGEPVKIVDLAEQMIRLSGYEVRSLANPDGIEIVFSGLRPGEKLYEELLIGGAVTGTEHPKVMTAYEEFLELKDLIAKLVLLEETIIKGDATKVREMLIDMARGYAPIDEIADYVWNSRVMTEKVTRIGASRTR